MGRGSKNKEAASRGRMMHVYVRDEGAGTGACCVQMLCTDVYACIYICVPVDLPLSLSRSLKST